MLWDSDAVTVHSAPDPRHRTTALVERDPELRVFKSLLDGVPAKGHVALVAGEAGIGKTSVLLAAATAYRASGGHVWWGGCDALDTPHPLAPLLDIAREQRQDFAPLLQGPRPALFEAVLEALRSAPRPVLVVVEDAHWADDATLDWLKFLGRRIASTRSVLAVSYRDDEVTASHPLRRVIGELPPGAVLRVPLARFSPQGVEQLARQMGRPAAGVHSLTQGNAFFVTEVLREPAGTADRVPATVQDVVLARFARLDDRVQELLVAVAVVPGRAERWLIDAMQAPTLADIEAALASGLVVAEGDSLAFRHELGRVAVESSLSLPRAQARHARVLALLSDPAHSVAAARLVHHAVQARDRAAISLHAPRAAAEATGRGSHREAHAQWKLALREGAPADDEERARWLEAAHLAAAVVGSADDVLTACKTLEALALARGSAARAALWRSRQINPLIGLLRHPEALAASADAVARVEALPASAEKAWVLANDALLSMLERDCAPASQRAREAMAMAEACGDANSRALAQTALGTSLLFVDHAAGVALLLEQLAQRRAAGIPRLVAGALSMLGSGLGELMVLQRAEALLSESDTLAQAHEVDGIRDYASAWLALVRMWRGQWANAAALASGVLERTAGQDMSRLMALLALGRVRVRRGDPGAAAVLDEARAMAAPSGTLQRVGPTCAARAEAAFTRGDLAAVRAEVAAGLPLAQAKGHPWFIGELAYWGWRIGAIDVMPPGVAEPYALEVAGHHHEAAAAWLALGCPYEQARALAAADEPAQREALEIFDRLGARPAAETLRRSLRDAGVRGVVRGVRDTTRANPCQLTQAEMKTLALMAQGLRNAEIAQRVHRSVRTVDHHVASVLAKMGVESRQAAVERATHEGWLARE